MNHFCIKKAVCIFILAAFFLVFVPGCGESGEEAGRQKGKDKAAPAAQAVNAEAGSEKDKFLKETEEALDALDERIRSFKEKMAERWSKMEPKARKEAKEALESMKKQRRALTQKLEKLRDSSAEAWEEMKKQFWESYESLRKSLEEERPAPPKDKETEYI
ncbi:MAG: hypothetical protein ACOCUC_02450 [bacterium]